MIHTLRSIKTSFPNFRSNQNHFYRINSKIETNYPSNLCKMSTLNDSKSDKVFKFAGIQLLVGENKQKNLENAEQKIREAASKGVHMICLPEIFNGPYQSTSFREYSEVISEDPKTSPSSCLLSSLAKELKVYLIGGSIPERDSLDKIFNTCLVFNPEGSLVAKHRKMHLFDIDVPGKITFKESSTLSAGNSVTTFDTEFCTIGVSICYDIRFPELAQLARNKGAKVLVYPGAFNMTTGPAHWELLGRARAVDNQCFVAMVSPARNPESSYQAWGHSSVISPWGEVLTTTDHQPSIIYSDIDLSKVEEFRENIPTSKQKRNDVYELVHKS